jgi:GntP family gluconate:H+ symporter
VVLGGIVLLRVNAFLALLTSGMIVAMIEPTKLSFHAAYLVAAIGAGSLVGSWMNDSGFWIFAKMGGLTEVQTLKSWTPTLAIVGMVAFAMVVILAGVLPLR